MDDPFLVDDLYAPILCVAARLVLAALPDPVCPRGSRLTRRERLAPILKAVSPILLATSSSSTPDLHALLVLVHPDIYSIEHACTSGHVALLDIWRVLAATGRVDSPLAYSTSCMDLASGLGHTHVLDWWFASPFKMKYTHMAVQLAVINAYGSVVEWWLAHQPELELKAHWASLLAHAIEYNLGEVLHRWIDYGLPLERLDTTTNRELILQVLFLKSWTVLDNWWVRARTLGIVYPVEGLHFHPYPLIQALACGEEGLFEWWVGPAEQPLPEELDTHILDTASAGGLPGVLAWWAKHRGITSYSAAAMDQASFGTPVRWKDKPNAFACAYASISAERRIAVLNWWRDKSGVPLKFSNDLPRSFERAASTHVRVVGKSRVVEVLLPVLQWWLNSGLEVDWTTNARPEMWDSEVKRWWEQTILKLEGEDTVNWERIVNLGARPLSAALARIVHRLQK